MILTQLAEQLVGVCADQGLDYDPEFLPIKLTADCYIVYCTPMVDDCKLQGRCQVKQFYALTGGKTIKITNGVS